ncbi:hypothetical protein ED733_000240 [Metarhizium rileyi]|uniref:NADP-dependent oxidoreductase domain-containing protein n=1 Tax=Metarhizium rileyi (strain RCEF 4871) TaxID=1649241 RepID=A0A5C6G412_METRR|nr:hypothetical protein ED733_000240 [Metarhizium rileyi]
MPYRHIDTAYAYGNGIIEREIGEAIADSHIARSEIFVVTKLHNTFHDPQDVKTGLDMSLRNLNLDYGNDTILIYILFLESRILLTRTIKAIAEVHSKTPAQIILAWLTRQGIAVVPKSSQPSRIESNYDINFSLTAEEQWKMATLVGAEPPTSLERNTLRKYSQARVRAANLNQLCDIEQGTLLMSRADHKSTSHSTQTLSPALNKQLAESVSRIPVADAIYNSEEAYTACSGGGLTTNEAYATDFTGNGIDSHNSIDLSEGNQNVSPGKSALHMAVESKSLPMVS